MEAEEAPSPAEAAPIVEMRSSRMADLITGIGGASAPTAVRHPAGRTAGGGAARDSALDELATGFFTVAIDVAIAGSSIEVRRSALLRTARKLMRGEVFVPARLWSNP